MNSMTRRAAWPLGLIIALCSFGSSAAGPVTGQRPLLVIMVEYSDSTFTNAQYRTDFESRIFGPGDPCVAGYFTETSHGSFTYAPAANGETDGVADGLVSVTMNISVDDIPEGNDYRRDAMALADQYFNYNLYDSNRDGTIQNHELAVLVIHATGGETGKTRTASPTTLDKVRLGSLPVAVMSDLAPDYVLYHELAHVVDYFGYTGDDLYNLRDGLQIHAMKWDVAVGGGVAPGASRYEEIALELDAGQLGTNLGVSAYRDQNGQLSLAAYDLVSERYPVVGPIARAGLAADLSVAQLTTLRVVTACQLQDGRFKLIVWDMDFNWTFTRRDDYTGGHASDLAVTAVSSSRVVVALRTVDGLLKFIAFDVSRGGDLTRLGSLVPGDEATEINLLKLSSTRVVAAFRSAGGNLKVISVDLSNADEIAVLGTLTTDPATDIDLAQVSLRRVVTSSRQESGAIAVRLFNVSRAGVVTQLGSWEGGAVCDSSIQCTGRSDPITSDMTPRTSVIAGLSLRRLAVAWVDPDKLMQVRTLDYVEDGTTLTEVGSYTSEDTYLSTRLVWISGASFATFAQIDGQVWTGNHFGLLGGYTNRRMVHFDPYTKLKLGWLPYTELSGPPGSSVAYSLLPMGSGSAHAVVVRVPGHRETEYFILEVRNRDSVYESALNDEGLAIWHVDEEKPYPHPFVSLEWLGGSSETALWSADEADLLRYSGRSNPAGSRWSDFSLSGISVRGIEGFEPGGISFVIRF